MKRIIMTGTSGFLGHHLFNYLSKDNDVKALSVRSNNLENITKEISDFKPEVFIHVGWAKGNSFNDIHNIEQFENVKIGAKILEYLYKNKNLHFICFGSFSEYEENKFSKEIDLECPHSDYGLAKYMFRLISEVFCNKNSFSWTWLRPCYIYGENDVETRLIPKVIKSCLKGEDIELNSCDSVIDYLYIEDFVKAVSILIDNKELGIFNICSGQQYIIKDVVNKIKKICNSSSKITFDSSKDRKNFPKYICGDNSKLVKSINWKPKWSLEAGLKKTIETYNEK